MSVNSLNHLVDFHRFVGEKLRSGEPSLTPDDILAEWRDLHPDPFEIEGDLAAIQEAIDDMDNGDVGIPFEDFDREFRARRNLPTKP